MADLVGRVSEQRTMREALDSTRAELVALYGRRRVGKTFLIREVYREHLGFELIGIHEGPVEVQLRAFATALGRMSGAPAAPMPPRDWYEAFTQLRTGLTKPLKRRKRKLVVFFDELPWLSSRRSGFLPAFEHFWNSWASTQKQLVVVVCGSSASWMLERVVHQRGGLHNRVTRRLRVEPFTLAEAEALLLRNGVVLDRYQCVELYMALGGVPHYLEQVRRGESAAQSLDRLCFARDGSLREEFSHLYASLFDKPERHEAVVRALAGRPRGLTRTALLAAAGLPSGGRSSRVLEELEESGFIMQLAPPGRVSRDAVYWLGDEFTLFHFKWLERAKAGGAGTWLARRGTPPWRAWSGLAFEALCLKHVPQIKQALGIAAVETVASSWAQAARGGREGAQVDLVIERADRAVNLCEVKFSEGEFVIGKPYAAELAHKRDAFREATKSRSSLFLTLVTTYGVRPNEHAQALGVQVVTMNSLFAPGPAAP